MNAFASPGVLLRALAPELLLAASAMLLLLAAVWRPITAGAHQRDPHAAEGGERTAVLARFAAVACLLAALVVGVAWADGAPGTDDLRIAGDGMRWALALVVLLGTALALTLIEAEQERSRSFGPEVPALVLLAATGMLILTGARDLIIAFLGVELMSLAVYVLAGVNRRSRRGAEAAIKYFLLGAVSSGFLLYGMALLFGATGSTRFTDIAQWAAATPALSPLFVVGLALLLVGLAFKVAAAPFHLWTPDVYEGAPLPITAFMSATVKTAAFALFARVLVDALPTAAGRWHVALWWLAALTMIVGNVTALAQRNVVRMLAYSSIAHAGYLLVALVPGSDAGSRALVFYLVAYTLATMGAFAALVTVNDGRDSAPSLDDVAGLWIVRPWLASALAVCLLSLMGMPLVGGVGFFAKWYVLQAVLQAPAPQTILSVLLVLTSAVSAGYYLVVIGAMFMRPRPEGRPVPSMHAGPRALLIAAVGTLLVLGVYPTPLSRFADLAVRGGGADVGPAAPARLQTAHRTP
ncbi:MAG: NADH-quinone oxidoreductase subunit N [Gemmatimonadetes bacterium]|nr:NADH-quinone oxidoreductase subunit N [Gemmatimonadota bacterium]